MNEILLTPGYLGGRGRPSVVVSVCSVDTALAAAVAAAAVFLVITAQPLLFILSVCTVVNASVSPVNSPVMLLLLLSLTATLLVPLIQ